uniref:Uncharacterized protein n=1 Tax=Moniliophthora roreri TaxID=221103 RepID=A0A0W0GFP7_MONRR
MRIWGRAPGLSEAGLGCTVVVTRAMSSKTALFLTSPRKPRFWFNDEGTTSFTSQSIKCCATCSASAGHPWLELAGNRQCPAYVLDAPLRSVVRNPRLAFLGCLSSLWEAPAPTTLA